jgi:hypothetical protein
VRHDDPHRGSDDGRSARLTVFPKGKHDDQVDSTAQMLDWFKRAGQEPQDWMWQQYKQAQARGPQPKRPEPLSVMAKRLGLLRPL